MYQELGFIFFVLFWINTLVLILQKINNPQKTHFLNVIEQITI